MSRFRSVGGAAAILVSILASGVSPVTALAATATTTTLDVPSGTQYGSFTVTGHVRPAPQPFNGFIPAINFIIDADGPGLPSPLDANGDASTEFSLSPGTHSISASFGGLGDYDPSQSDPATVAVGVATQVALQSSRNPALDGQSVTITATVSPDAITGGALTIVDAFDGSTLASSSVGGGTVSASVTRAFATGAHELTATYTGDGDYGPSQATLTETVNADTFVNATGLRVQYATFYPYKDGYRDTERISGRLNETGSVVIRIYRPSGSLLKTVNLGTRAPGAYAYVWNGRYASGTILPSGTYKVVQRLTDSIGNVKTASFSVSLSKKKLIWTTSRITLYGAQYSASADPGNGYVSTSRSSYYRGVKLSSGSAGVAVQYTFKVHSAVVYGSSIVFGVLGRSPNGRQVVEGLWNRAYCSPRYVGCYDVKAIGPGYQWWSMSASSGLHIESRTAHGLVFAPYTGVVRTFDVAKVRLTYRWAALG